MACCCSAAAAAAAKANAESDSLSTLAGTKRTQGEVGGGDRGHILKKVAYV